MCGPDTRWTSSSSSRLSPLASSLSFVFGFSCGCWWSSAGIDAAWGLWLWSECAWEEEKSSRAMHWNWGSDCSSRMVRTIWSELKLDLRCIWWICSLIFLRCSCAATIICLRSFHMWALSISSAVALPSLLLRSACSCARRKASRRRCLSTFISLLFSLRASSSLLNWRYFCCLAWCSLSLSSTCRWCSWTLCWNSSCLRLASSAAMRRFIISWKERLADSSCCSALLCACISSLVFSLSFFSSYARRFSSRMASSLLNAACILASLSAFFSRRCRWNSSLDFWRMRPLSSSCLSMLASRSC
mmetsp:Transcript_42032/g.104947  ORF Transcript_42032/g.104947 Transcript_42032/m.104947 type:complete len:302 (+) Transcript_42032:433-1338(+)